MIEKHIKGKHEKSIGDYSPFSHGTTGGTTTNNKKEETKKALILKLYKEGMSPYRIASTTGICKSYVYRIVRFSDDKGNKKNLGEILGEGIPLPKPSFPVELSLKDEENKNVHGQRIRAFIHHHGETFLKKDLRHWVMVVYGREVEVQVLGREILCRSKARFKGINEEKALWNSLNWWRRVLERIENMLKVIIFKRGSVAFEFTYQEFETNDSPVARDCEKKNNRWMVFHSEDGKLRLSVDWSEGSPSHETHHARDSFADSVTFGKFVNAICNHPEAPQVHELAKIVLSLAMAQQKQTKITDNIIKILEERLR